MPTGKNRLDPMSAMLLAGFLFLDVFIWSGISSKTSLPDAHTYFLNVTQGDAELVILPGNIKILVDAGYDASVIASLQSVMPHDDAYIDLAIISEANPATMAGFASVLEHYSIGVFIDSGRPLALPPAARNIPAVPMAAGDSIHIENEEGDLLSILGPDSLFAHSPSAKDSDLVELLQTRYWRALFTANIDTNAEDFLAKRYPGKINADILKVADHGSKYSSSAAFLKAVSPKIAVIETATKGTGGKVSEEILKRLAENTSSTVFQTGKTGIIGVRYDTIRKKLIYGP